MIYNYFCNWSIIDRPKPVLPNCPPTKQGRKCHAVFVRSLLREVAQPENLELLEPRTLSLQFKK